VPALSPGVRTLSTTSCPRLVEAVVVVVGTDLGAVVFSGFDFWAGELARGLREDLLLALGWRVLRRWRQRPTDIYEDNE